MAATSEEATVFNWSNTGGMFFDVPIDGHPRAAIAPMPLAQQVLIQAPKCLASEAHAVVPSPQIDRRAARGRWR